MIEMKRVREPFGSRWQVRLDGQMLFEGTMPEARAVYARLQAERLNQKSQRRTGGKKIYR